jgi:hypothetical protein
MAINILLSLDAIITPAIQQYPMLIHCTQIQSWLMTEPDGVTSGEAEELNVHIHRGNQTSGKA